VLAASAWAQVLENHVASIFETCDRNDEDWPAGSVFHKQRVYFAGSASSGTNRPWGGANSHTTRSSAAVGEGRDVSIRPRVRQHRSPPAACRGRDQRGRWIKLDSRAGQAMWGCRFQIESPVPHPSRTENNPSRRIAQQILSIRREQVPPAGFPSPQQIEHACGAPQAPKGSARNGPCRLGHSGLEGAQWVFPVHASALSRFGRRLLFAQFERGFSIKTELVGLEVNAG